MTAIQQFELPDGRLLDFRVSGPTDGVPLVFHNGTPGSCTPVRFVEAAAHERGLRVVATSRPGYGGSTRQPGRSVVDVVDDTKALLTSLGADRCLVAGVSGGGPHALACGARLEGTVAVLAVASVAPGDGDGLDFLAGMGEDNLLEFGAAREGEAALRAFLGPIAQEMMGASLESIMVGIESLLAEVDKAVMNGEFGEDLVASFHEALRVSADGQLDDDLAFVKPWGFDLAEIAVPTMIWQGSEDKMVPGTHGPWLASAIPTSLLRYEEGEGHLSIGVRNIGRMFDELVTALD